MELSDVLLVIEDFELEENQENDHQALVSLDDHGQACKDVMAKMSAEHHQGTSKIVKEIDYMAG